MGFQRRDKLSEANPFRPNVPDDVRDVSRNLYAFLQEQVTNIRHQHSLGQAGDSITPWEHMTYVGDEQRFTLGSLGRFTHPDYGIIVARYVRFGKIISATPGAPLGFDTNTQDFQWLLTDDLARSSKQLAQGVAASFELPVQNQFGWMIVAGVNIHDLNCTTNPKRFDKVAWDSLSKVEVLNETSGPPIGKIFGKVFTHIGDHWVIPAGSIYINSLDAVESAAAKLNVDSIEEQITKLQQKVNEATWSVDVKLNESDISIADALGVVNRTASLLNSRILSLDLGGVQGKIEEQLNLSANLTNVAQVAADNAAAVELRTYSYLTVANQYSRTASISKDQAGLYAETATEMANSAAISQVESGISAAASATSATSAGVSATAAGTSATAAQNSATNAATSATNASNSAGTAATQASNASTSAGQAATSASQASTSATNAAGSASSASSSATTATNAATTATTQATNASNSASTASTQASNASTSAGQASTSATNAGTQATNAATSASAANTSATNASTSATTATTQAGNATTSATNAAVSLARTFPAQVTALADGYTLTLTGVDTAAANIAGGEIFLTNGRYGVREVSTTRIAHKSLLSAVATRVYEIEAEFEVVTYVSGNITLTVGAKGLDAAFAHLGYTEASTVVTAAGVTKVTIRVSDTANAPRSVVAWTAASIWLRPEAYWTQTSGAGGVVQVRGIKVTDVTAVVNAETQASTATTQASNASTSASQASTSATGAAGSASSASTSATNAANSATTATTQAGTATTQASAASTSASNAATSATNASGSASTATTQASNASVSATNAASSATTATTQATNASTSATNASNSAASANTSSILAAQAGIGALNLNPTFADWTGGPTTLPANWPNTVGALPTVSRGTGTYSPYALELEATVTTDSYLHQLYPVNSGLEKLGKGTYVLEADIELLSGSLVSAGLALNEYTSANAFVTNALLIFSVDPDITGAVLGVGATGKIYRFRKVVTITNATVTKGALVIVMNDAGFGAEVVKKIRFHKAAVRPASDAEAAVVSSTGVVVDVAARIATASFVTTTIAGSATAAIRLESRAIGGAANSHLALEAEELQFWNTTTGVRVLAGKISNGASLWTGDMQVGGGIRVGTLRIAVALQSFQVQAGDGDTLDWGVDLTNNPKFIFDSTGLVPKTAAQAYDIKVTSLTSTGGVLYAKIMTPGTTSTITSTAGTNVGGSPPWQMQKADAADASDGYYTFSVTLDVIMAGYISGEPNSAQGRAEYDVYVRPSGGSWTYVDTIGKNYFANANGTVSKTLSGAVYWAGAIGQHGTNTEFGVAAITGTVTAFGSVTYTKIATSGVSSATPSGQKVIITVIPQNV